MVFWEIQKKKCLLCSSLPFTWLAVRLDAPVPPPITTYSMVLMVRYKVERRRRLLHTNPFDWMYIACPQPAHQDTAVRYKHATVLFVCNESYWKLSGVASNNI